MSMKQQLGDYCIKNIAENFILDLITMYYFLFQKRFICELV